MSLPETIQSQRSYNSKMSLLNNTTSHRNIPVLKKDLIKPFNGGN